MFVDTSMRAQIDEFLASGRVRRVPASHAAILPPKRQLDWASLGADAPASAVLSAASTQRRVRAATAPRLTDEWPADDSVVVHVGPCAAAEGSKRASRYRLWSVGATVGELRERGLRLSDLRRDVAAERIVLRRPSPSPAQGQYVPET
jgi:hypothetical protein